jgi:uncharacterized protein YjiS (DUF1127 family)
MDATQRALMNVSELNILGLFERIGGWLIRASLKPIKVVRIWNRTQRESRALLNMSDHMLKDIGVSRMDVMQEERKVFW